MALVVAVLQICGGLSMDFIEGGSLSEFLKF